MDIDTVKFYLGIIIIALIVIIVEYYLYLFLSHYMVINNATDFYFAIKNYMWLLVPPILGFIGLVFLVNYIDE